MEVAINLHIKRILHLLRPLVQEFPHASLLFLYGVFLPRKQPRQPPAYMSAWDSPAMWARSQQPMGFWFLPETILPERSQTLTEAISPNLHWAPTVALSMQTIWR